MENIIPAEIRHDIQTINAFLDNVKHGLITREAAVRKLKAIRLKWQNKGKIMSN